jgi:hypothetical protein
VQPFCVKVISFAPPIAATTAEVPSLEASSTTITSPIKGCPRTQASTSAIREASL